MDGELAVNELTIEGALTARCFSSDWSSTIELDFPLSIEATITQSGDLGISFDERLFDLQASIAVDSGKGLTLQEARRGAGTVSIPLPRGKHVLYPQASVRSLFPSDNIAAPVGTVVRAGNSEELGRRTEVGATAWGAELRVVWDVVGGYSYPASVSIVSVGPSPVPVGTVVLARVPRTIRPLLISDSDDSLAIQPLRVDGDLSHYPIALVAPLPAGEKLTVQFTSGQEGAVVPSSYWLTHVPQVSTQFDDASRQSARDTGKYSVAPVTASGSSLTNASTLGGSR
ncbi:hypothetical protein FVP99_18305 [Microbacterium wangchenii]|nr:hypothetical protein FVP99_18305 [Microbacterium wangchenii]